jgi:uncharacterized membrane protein YhaH (DUF805 family)
MTPIDWAKRPVLEKYADFTGRAPRAEYWWFVLGMIIVFILLSIIESIVGLNRMILGVYGPLTALLWLAVLVPSLAVGVRRLHDTNRSGWWLLLMVPYCIAGVMMAQAMAAGGATGFGSAGILALIGFFCVVVLLVFYCLPGTPGDNQYGPDPYGGAGTASVAAE